MVKSLIEYYTVRINKQSYDIWKNIQEIKLYENLESKLDSHPIIIFIYFFLTHKDIWQHRQKNLLFCMFTVLKAEAYIFKPQSMF